MPDVVRVVRPAPQVTVRVRREDDRVRVVRPAAPPAAVRVSRQGPPGPAGSAGVDQAYVDSYVQFLASVIDQNVASLSSAANQAQQTAYQAADAADAERVRALAAENELDQRVTAGTLPPLIDLGGPNNTTGA